MKSLAAAVLLSFISIGSQAAPSKTFYQCDGLAGVDEYRVGVNLRNNKAGFFDNDATAYLTYNKTDFFETAPPKTIMTFSGFSKAWGGLRLAFEYRSKTATLYSIDSAGQESIIGTADCHPAQVWDDLK